MCQKSVQDKRTTGQNAKASRLQECQTHTAGDISLWIIKRVDVEKEEENIPGGSENNGVKGKW